MPDLYAVTGHPVAHSKSPFIHAGFARQTGQDMQYEALLSPLDAFPGTVSHFRQRGGKGMNITVPFKLEAYHLANHLTERARAARSVNTFRFDGETILGDNTDGVGLVRDITANLGFAITGKRVLVAGAGGAARGIILPLLAQQPCQLVIINRTLERAQELQAFFAASGNIVAGSGHEFAGEVFDLVINATSASLDNSLPPLPPVVFSQDSVAYDLVYGKGLSPFLLFAQQQGAARVADGAGMLVEQAAESFFLWRGVRPETAAIIQTLKDPGLA